MPLEIGEPEQDERDALVLDPPRDGSARLLARGCPIPALDLRHEDLLNAKSPRRGRRARGFVAS
jgi:hypothetical protein